jgi:AcrR family transcriptional regulator
MPLRTKTARLVLPPGFRLADDLEAAALAVASKSERTRLRLLAAGAALLDEVPFAKLRPAHLADHAEISRPLLYHYFSDLEQLVTCLAELFEQRVVGLQSHMDASDRPYDYPQIFGQLASIVRVYLRNRGLMQLMFAVGEQPLGVTAVSERVIFEFNKRLGQHTVPPPGLRFGAQEKLLAGYVIGGGIDELLRQLFQRPRGRLPVPEAPADLLRLVQMIAVLRYRQRHDADPPNEEVRVVAEGADANWFADCVPAGKPATTAGARRSSAPDKPRSSPRSRAQRAS